MNGQNDNNDENNNGYNGMSNDDPRKKYFVNGFDMNDNHNYDNYKYNENYKKNKIRTNLDLVFLISVLVVVLTCLTMCSIGCEALDGIYPDEDCLRTSVSMIE